DVDQGVNAAREGDWIAFFGHDTSFHRRLLELAGNGEAADVVERVRNRIRHRGLGESLTPARLVDSAQSHSLIVEQLRSGTRQGAEEAMRQHLLLGRGAMADKDP